MNVTWAVPRCRRPNPFRLRLRSLVLIAIGGLATIVATILSGLASSAAVFGADLDWLGAVLIVVAAIAVNAAVFVVGFWICVPTNRSVRSLLPGAVTAAVVWQVLQLGWNADVEQALSPMITQRLVFVLGLIGVDLPRLPGDCVQRRDRCRALQAALPTLSADAIHRRRRAHRRRPPHLYRNRQELSSTRSSRPSPSASPKSAIAPQTPARTTSPIERHTPDAKHRTRVLSSYAENALCKG